MGHALKTAFIVAALIVTGLAPVLVTAQEPNQDPNQNQNQGQVGGVSIDASGSNEVYTSDAGQSGQTTINTGPGAMSANTADGQGNREERRAARRAAREAGAAAAEAAPIAVEPVAAEPAPAAAPEPVAEAPAAAAAPVVALPNTGTGVASQSSVALALLLAGLAAVGAFVTFRRVRPA